jgi:hypothetical protein
MIRRSSQVWQFVLMAGALVVLSACSAVPKLHD